MRLPQIASLLIALGTAGCAGVFSGSRVVAPGSYVKIELRDVEPLGLEDQNVEVVAPVGSLGSSDHCDLIKVALQAPPGVPFGGNLESGFGAAFANIVGGAFGGMLLDSNVTITLPRARYAEVRDLPPHTLVRVRGYISRWLGLDCDRRLPGHARAIWVDTLETVSAGHP